jgi:hypothetical protein
VCTQKMPHLRCLKQKVCVRKLSHAVVDPTSSSSLALSGEFSVGLYDYGSIRQTGLVPNNAGSLQFEAAGMNSGALLLNLGGQNLSYSEIFAGSAYNVYSANIPTGMDGQMEALTLFNEEAGIELDDIEFVPAPEPSECALMGVGAIGLCLYFRRRQRLC